MDELFLLPSAPVAVPTAYWIGNDTVSSAIMLIEPSMDEYKKVLAGMKNRVSNEFDMDLVNDLYAGNAMVLPNDYWVVSGEFRKKTHNTYLKEGETWDAEEILNRTKYVHFSDWPFPKPWYPSEPEEKWAVQPPCKPLPDGTKDCKDRDAWLWVYADFKKRREVSNLLRYRFHELMDRTGDMYYSFHALSRIDFILDHDTGLRLLYMSSQTALTSALQCLNTTYHSGKSHSWQLHE